MIPLISLVLVIVLSMVIVKIAAVALVQTGLSAESARFQARSAFTGAGFTTAESEQVVTHPVRRRIVGILMLLGNAGIVTVAATLFLSFAQDNDAEPRWFEGKLFLFFVLLLMLFVLWKIASSDWVDRVVSRVIERALRRYTDIEVRDYVSLFHLQGDYAIAEMVVEEEDWVVDSTLMELRLNEEGILVLGIERRDGYLGAPRGHTVVRVGDTLVLYGRDKNLADLDERRRDFDGYRAHVRALREQGEIEKEQDRKEMASALQAQSPAEQADETDAQAPDPGPSDTTDPPPRP